MRLFPGSLKGQLILLTLVALLLSQGASFLVLLDDHTARMKSEWFRNMLTRIATVKEVIETVPPESHAKISKQPTHGPFDSRSSRSHPIRSQALSAKACSKRSRKSSEKAPIKSE